MPYLELLVYAKTGNASTPLGEVLSVRQFDMPDPADDDAAWRRKEDPRVWIAEGGTIQTYPKNTAIIRVNGATRAMAAGVAEELWEAWAAGDPRRGALAGLEPEEIAHEARTRLFKRAFRIQWSSLPQAAKDELLANYYLEVSRAQARNYLLSKLDDTPPAGL